jgi:hypothetical protein
LTLARRIAATAALPRHAVGDWTIAGGTVTTTPAGWLVSLRVGWCRLSDHDEHTPANAKRIGRSGAWTFWKNDGASELIATGTIDDLHADCYATRDRDLAWLRAVVETLWR